MRINRLKLCFGFLGRRRLGSDQLGRPTVKTIRLFLTDTQIDGYSGMDNQNMNLTFVESVV